MYSVADCCAQTCATKTSHIDNPRSRRVFEATLPIRANNGLAFNLQLFKVARALPERPRFGLQRAQTPAAYKF